MALAGGRAKVRVFSSMYYFAAITHSSIVRASRSPIDRQPPLAAAWRARVTSAPCPRRSRSGTHGVGRGSSAGLPTSRAAGRRAARPTRPRGRCSPESGTVLDGPVIPLLQTGLGRELILYSHRA
jgi:hypothetical protein